MEAKAVNKAVKKKKTGFLRGLIPFCMLAACGYFAISIVQDVGTFFSLKASISQNQKQLEEVKAEKDEMTATKNNLTNPDYIEYLARGKYLVSKENEQIFKFPPIDKKSTGTASE